MTKLATIPSITKTCIECKAVFSIADFHLNKSKKDGLNNRCKDCANAFSVAWNNANRARLNARQIARKRKRIEQGLCRHCSNPLLPRHNQLCEKHYIGDVAKCRLGKGSLQEIEALQHKLKTQEFRCPYTGDILILGINAHLDHILPVSRFPEHRSDLNNVEWVSKRVNLAKGDMTKNEFLQFCLSITKYASSPEVKPVEYDGVLRSRNVPVGADRTERHPGGVKRGVSARARH